MTGSPNIWAYEKRKRCITHTNMVVKYTTCMNAVDSSIAVYRCILCSACKRIRPLSCVGFFKLVWTPLLYLLSLFCLWSGVPPSVKEGCTTSTRLRDNKRNSSSMRLRFMHVARAMRFLIWNLSWFLFPGTNQKLAKQCQLWFAMQKVWSKVLMYTHVSKNTCDDFHKMQWQTTWGLTQTKFMLSPKPTDL